MFILYTKQNINNRTDLRIYLIYNELPIIVIKSMNEGACSICLENFIINDEVNKLSRNHMFHKKCLDGWIKNNNCPLCRKYYLNIYLIYIQIINESTFFYIICRISINNI